MSDHETYIREAVALARKNIAEGGRPYGAVVVKDGAVMSRAVNTIHRTEDPTDHAEMVGLREASRKLGSRDLSGCVVYASGQPCPMCHAAMRLSGIREGYFAYAATEAETYGLLSAGIYAELCRPLDEQPMRLRQIRPEGDAALYAAWKKRESRESSGTSGSDAQNRLCACDRSGISDPQRRVASRQKEPDHAPRGTRPMAIEPALISAVSAIAGTVVGGLASLMTSVFTQRYQDRLQRVSREVAKREALYSEFITVAAKLMLTARLTEFSGDALDETLPALVNRIRLVASDKVVAEADTVVRDLIRTSLDAGVNARRLAEEALADHDYPLLHFSAACRAELEALYRQIR